MFNEVDFEFIDFSNIIEKFFDKLDQKNTSQE